MFGAIIDIDKFISLHISLLFVFIRDKIHIVIGGVMRTRKGEHKINTRNTRLHECSVKCALIKSAELKFETFISKVRRDRV